MIPEIPGEIWYLAYGIFVGFVLGTVLMMNRELDTIDRELSLMEDRIRLLTAYHAATEVLSEHGLETEAYARIKRELDEVDDRLDHEPEPDPSPLDKIRDRLPF